MSALGAPGLPALVRDSFRGGLAGLAAGIVFLGVVSRIAMRISAVLDPSAEGLITESENVVGEISVGGTLGLVFFIGTFGGLMVGMVWVLIRDWLPTTLWQRIILASVVATLLGSFVVIANENRDFRILQPAEANIAMFISILGFAGGATAGLDHLLDRHLPNEPGLSFLYGGLSALGALVVLPLLVGAFFTTGLCDCEQPPSIAGAFLVVASVATITGWSRYFGALPALSRLQPFLPFIGVAGVAGASLFGGLYLFHEIEAIL